MARGRLLKTKRKEAYHLAKAEEKGRLQAQREHYRKLGFMEILKEKLLKFTDKLEMDDVAFLVSMIGLTIIVKHLIDTTEVLRSQLSLITSGGIVTPTHVVGALSLFYPLKPPAFEGIFPDEIDWLISASIAYFVLKNGKELLALGTSGIKTIVGLMLGVSI